MRTNFRQAVFTISYGHDAYLPAWLQSVVSLRDEAEIHLLENGPTMDYVVPQWVHSHHRKDNLGYAAGINFLVQHSKASTYLFLNPDVRASAATLRTLLHKADASRALVAPLLCGQKGVYRSWAPFPEGSFYPIRLLRHAVKALQAEFEPDWMNGACWALAREVYEMAGGLDEQYFVFTEDLAFCRALAELGIPRRLIGSLRVWHPCWEFGGSRLEFMAKNLGYYGRNRDMRSFLRWQKWLRRMGRLTPEDYQKLEQAILHAT